MLLNNYVLKKKILVFVNFFFGFSSDFIFLKSIYNLVKLIWRCDKIKFYFFIYKNSMY